MEFPSEDLDPKLFGRDSDNKELQQLRDDLEREITEKKLEIANRIKKEKEEQALEKEREEKRKELANKNVTVDIKGELVYVKSLDINKFINDFSKSKSKFKDIRTIEYEPKIKRTKRRQSTMIEKNPDVDKVFQEEIPKKKNKQKNRKNIISEPSKNLGLGLGFFFDKNKEPIVGAGSNFDIMNPVCGVNLTEDKKMKSGGKDFFHKYNKYSIQVFEETLNRTISANFYQNNINNIINNTNPNNNVMSLKKKKTIKDILFKPKKEKEQDNKNQKNNINNKKLNVPNESNDQLLVKAKNLKLALNNLDLISEGEERYLSEKKNYKNKNVIKRNQFIMELNKQKKKDYDEIDTFAKTLVGSDNWGVNLYNKSDEKEDFRIPKRPAYHDFKREVPGNIMNHIPRKRLPPINAINRLKDNNYGKTMSDGFFNRKKKKKLKALNTEENKNIQNENNDNNNNKKNEFNFSTTSNFYKNTMS